MRKGPLPGAPTIGVLNKHQLVNLYLLRVRPGWLGSQGDAELVLKPRIVETDGGERLDGGVSQCQLSSHCDDEVQVTKMHMSA